MSPLTRQEGAVLLRDAVAALAGRLNTEFGDLVPEASAERTAALAARLESGQRGVAPDDLVTLDSWIRLADSVMLHDDPTEAQVRADLAQQLRAVRMLLAPDGGPLTHDPRDD
jgi:hypothetical protein